MLAQARDNRGEFGKSESKLYKRNIRVAACESSYAH